MRGRAEGIHQDLPDEAKRHVLLFSLLRPPTQAAEPRFRASNSNQDQELPGHVSWRSRLLLRSNSLGELAVEILVGCSVAPDRRASRSSKGPIRAASTLHQSMRKSQVVAANK